MIQYKTSAILVLAGALLSGCGQKNQELELIPLEEQALTSAAQELPSASSAGVTTKLDEASVALKEKNYDKAAVSLLQIDRQSAGRPLTMEESFAYNKRMVELQSALAQAAADGDPRAQRAVEMLRKNRQAR
jgi:outer membrane lipopolysaccharide assembly protein LptE/RlpB